MAIRKLASDHIDNICSFKEIVDMVSKDMTEDEEENETKMLEKYDELEAGMEAHRQQMEDLKAEEDAEAEHLRSTPDSQIESIFKKLAMDGDQFPEQKEARGK